MNNLVLVIATSDSNDVSEVVSLCILFTVISGLICCNVSTIDAFCLHSSSQSPN